MDIFSKDNPDRPIWLGCLVFAALGYVLYFAALQFPSPDWGKELIGYFANSIKSLNTAAKVAALKSNDPFPAQAVILYCALGSIVLAGWCSYAWLLNNFTLQALLLRYRSASGKKKPSRFRLFFAGLVMTATSVFCWLIFFLLNIKTISWRDAMLFSTSIHTTSFLIACSAILAIGIPVAFACMYLALSKKP